MFFEAYVADNVLSGHMSVKKIDEHVARMLR